MNSMAWPHLRGVCKVLGVGVILAVALLGFHL